MQENNKINADYWPVQAAFTYTHSVLSHVQTQQSSSWTWYEKEGRTKLAIFHPLVAEKKQMVSNLT